MNDQQLSELVAESATKHKVPGAVAGVLADDETSFAAFGATGLPGIDVTVDTLFGLGSIAKSYTATMVMQLVDEGALTLDDTLSQRLPELRHPRADAITIRHLLSHTSGIEGEVELEGGSNEDALERFVETYDAPQVHEPGALFSYCNAGYMFLGRIVEKAVGEPYDRVWRTRLLDPIGAHSTALFPEEALLHRVAVGHMPDPSGELAVIPRWGWERPGLPEGSSTSITVGDLLRFARLHVDRGRTTDGRALVSEESVDLMHEVAVELPDDFLADAWGLGMSITRRSTAHIVGHSGNWAGHLAILQILPRQRGAIALLTNTTTSTAFLREVLETLYGEVFDIPAAATERPPVDQPLDVSAFTGRYERGPWQFEVSERDGALVLAPCILAPEKEQVFEPVAKDQFLMYSSVFDGKFPVTFLQTADGVLLHTTGRAFPQAR